MRSLLVDAQIESVFLLYRIGVFAATTSPGRSSASEPSSMRTTIRPEMTLKRWITWQVQVQNMGNTIGSIHR